MSSYLLQDLCQPFGVRAKLMQRKLVVSNFISFPSSSKITACCSQKHGGTIVFLTSVKFPHQILFYSECIISSLYTNVVGVVFLVAFWTSSFFDCGMTIFIWFRTSIIVFLTQKERHMSRTGFLYH